MDLAIAGVSEGFRTLKRGVSSGDVLAAAGYGGYRWFIAGRKKREEETPTA